MVILHEILKNEKTWKILKLSHRSEMSHGAPEVLIFSKIVHILHWEWNESTCVILNKVGNIVQVEEKRTKIFLNLYLNLLEKYIPLFVTTVHSKILAKKHRSDRRGSQIEIIAETIILSIIHRLVRIFNWGLSDRGFLAWFRIPILTNWKYLNGRL